MRKIPTLFKRDLTTHVVYDEVAPGCEWVLAGKGVPTRKFDGTCVMIDEDFNVWCRREVKQGKHEPDGFVRVSFDEETGKTVGWVPAETSDFWPLIVETGMTGAQEPGTYELVGPKINGNPEGMTRHLLWRHGSVVLTGPPVMTFDGLRESMGYDFPFEGVVWYHLDGRMAKLKKKDFAVDPRSES